MKRDCCTAEHAVDILIDKWSTTIIAELRENPHSFAELGKIDGITSQELAKTLNLLIREGVIAKKPIDGENVEENYTITAYGLEMDAIIESLKIWGTLIDET